MLLIALDGENAWEYYPYNGWYFLNAMYTHLAAHPRLKLMTLSEYVDAQRAAGIAPAALPQPARRQLGIRHAVHLDGRCRQEPRLGPALHGQARLR